MSELLDKGILEILNSVYQRGVNAGSLSNCQLLNRKDLCDKVLHIGVNTFDDNLRYEPDFPSVMIGNREKYYVPAVHEWLMNHQTFN